MEGFQTAKYINCHVRAYGKAGNASGIETGCENWKIKYTNHWQGYYGIAGVQGRYCTKYHLDMVQCGDGRRHRIQPYQPRRMEGCWAG